MADEEGIAGEKETRIFSRYPVWVILLVIVLLGSFLRLIKLGQSPPGLNQDEAVNAWNAYCLLKTGKDQAGVSWPIYYTRGLGGNWSTLFIYFLIPFQAICGLNIFSLRLAGAVGGIITILVVYFVGKRLFDRQVGLMAAFLLSLNPWHLQQSRWGHEATLSALLGIAPMAMLLWAGMPISDDKAGKGRPILAGLAGVITGVCCYGYQSVRIFMPVFLLAIALLALPEWRGYIKSRKGVAAVAAFILGFGITFGPLAWQHIFYPEGISRNALAQSKVGYFLASAPFGTAVKDIFIRYMQHFGPDFLFIHGDYLALQSPPGGGVFHWYSMPLMVLGLIFILRFFRRVSVRALLALVIAYPVGDSLYRLYGMHALRSAVGICSLVLLGAAGGVFGARWVRRRGREAAMVVTAVFFTAVIILNMQYFHLFYFKFNRDKDIYHLYNEELVEACKWLKPRLSDYDAVFFTTNNFNMPYMITLVTLGYDPEKWFNEPREFITRDIWEYYTHYGKMYFMYDRSFVPVLTALQQSPEPKRILFIIRPGEFELDKPVERIIRQDGMEVLWVCEAPSRTKSEILNPKP